MEPDPDVPLPDTLTLSADNPIAQPEEQNFPKAWGRLYPLRMFLQPVDLCKDTFTFGRSESCDVVASAKNFRENNLTAISKVHFKITLEDENVLTIEDCSKNGTYVNSKAIGRHKKCLLQNDDEIGVGLSILVYFIKVFKNVEQLYFPMELRCKYETSRLLGEGTFGEVKLVFSKTTGDKFAIKKIVKARTSFQNCNALNTTTYIANEVSILKSLSHPCVISMIEVLETNLAVFIVLEYMEGGELTNYITSKNKPLSEAESKLIFYQIVLGVQYLHKQGITHRDLKPENILLKHRNPETLVKVSDFGLSKIVSDTIFMATVCGTPLFTAPEVLDTNCKTYTQQIDIWSIGVILFYMLCKELPFQAKVRSELFNRILNAEYHIDTDEWKYVSDDAVSLVTKMLIRDPESRIQICNVVKHSWFEDTDMQETLSSLLKNVDNDSTVYFDQLKQHHFATTIPL